MAVSARLTFRKHVCGAFGRTCRALAGVGQAGPELLELLGLQAAWPRRFGTLDSGMQVTEGRG